MTTIDKDPQLNAMIWDDLRSSVESSGDEWLEYRKVMAKKVGKDLENLFAAYFAQNEAVEALAFSLTTAEYDDEGYGGFNFTGVRPKFNHGLVSPDTANWLNQVEDEYDAGYIESYIYGYRARQAGDFPEELKQAITQCAQIQEVLDKVEDFARAHWDECGVKVTPQSIQLFYSAEDLT